MPKLSDSDKHERSEGIARAQAVRKELGIGIEEIADIVGVSASTFRRWENRSYEASPTARQMAAICNRYNMSPSWMLMGIGPRELDKSKEEHAITTASDVVHQLSELSATAGGMVADLRKRILYLEHMVDALDKVNSNLLKQRDRR
jgi:transcriptional regulator with XRE-family HTH domain